MIKYLVMDVDGTLTDGKLYMGAEGEIMKAFSIKDGYGIKHILPQYEILPIIITARKSKIVTNRCDELNIRDVHQGVGNKLEKLQEIVDNLGECAYIGDDILDIQCMKPIKEAGGLVACPADAATQVKRIVNYVCDKNGGDGAVREFIEWLCK